MVQKRKSRGRNVRLLPLREQFMLAAMERVERDRALAAVRVPALAEVVLAERDRERDRGSGMMTGLAIGLAVVAVVGLGVVVCYLLFRRRDDGTPVPVQGLGGTVREIREIIREVPYTGGGFGAAAPAQAAAPRELLRNSGEAVMRTFSLPALGTRTEATRVATAYDLPAEVTVRTIGPPGAFAVFSYDPTELNLTDATMPTGDTLVVATTLGATLRLKARQVLWAKGSVPGVAVSVTNSPITTAITY